MKESEQIKALLNSQEGEISNRAKLFIELSAATQKIAELEAELELERKKSLWLARKCAVFDCWMSRPATPWTDRQWLAWAEEEVEAKNESAGTADAADADSERPAGRKEGRR